MEKNELTHIELHKLMLELNDKIKDVEVLSEVPTIVLNCADCIAEEIISISENLYKISQRVKHLMEQGKW